MELFLVVFLKFMTEIFLEKAYFLNKIAVEFVEHFFTKHGNYFHVELLQSFLWISEIYEFR